MLTLSEEELDVLEALVPDHQPNPKGGRPPTDKRLALAGIFWVLDNGAKWKDLPRTYGTKSSVHRWFLHWVKAGVFEELMRSMGTLIEGDGRFRLYECFVDGTFSKAKGGGDGIGCTKAGKGVANSQSKCNTGYMEDGGRRRSRFVGESGRRMAMKYQQLNVEERSALATLKRLGWSVAEMARELGRHRSTVGRELRRNAAPHDGCYRAGRAHERAVARRRRSRRNSQFGRAELARVEELLREEWSPEQVAGLCGAAASC